MASSYIPSKEEPNRSSSYRDFNHHLDRQKDRHPVKISYFLSFYQYVHFHQRKSQRQISFFSSVKLSFHLFLVLFEYFTIRNNKIVILMKFKNFNIIFLTLERIKFYEYYAFYQQRSYYIKRIFRTFVNASVLVK